MKTKDIRVRVSETLYKEVYKKAQSKGMNLSELVRYLLQKEVEK